MLKSCESFFRLEPTSVIDFAKSSGDLSEFRSFVPMCKTK